MSSGSKKEIFQHLKEVDRHLKAGNTDAAAREIEAVFQLDPDNVYARAYRERLSGPPQETVRRIPLPEEPAAAAALPPPVPTASTAPPPRAEKPAGRVATPPPPPPPARKTGTAVRKLAAVMFTDMVGYSTLTQRDEALALSLLDEHRRILRPIFTRHEGREVKTIGDAFLVEFTSVLEAVRCAIAIQKTLQTHNGTVRDENAISLRVGIHLADVISQDDDLIGDGVNLASRIQEQASPGGICISQDVYNQIRQRDEFGIEYLGDVELKNILAPVPLYRVLTSGAVVRQADEGIYQEAAERGRVAAKNAVLARHLERANAALMTEEYDAALAGVLTVLFLDAANADARRLEEQIKRGRIKAMKKEMEELRKVPREMLLEIYTRLLREAWGDGVLLSVERSLLENMRGSFQITDAEHRAIERQVQLECYAGLLKEAYEDLGRDPSSARLKRLEQLREGMRISDADHEAIEEKVKR